MAPKPKADRPKEPSSVALMDALSAFIRAYKLRMRSVLAEVTSGDSTPSRVMVVVVLRKHGSLPMGTIAAYVGLPKSNVTALVDDLEAEGVLRRKRDEEDRRVTNVELTAKGRALSAREYDAYERQLAAIFDLLEDSERAPMLSGFERMTRLVKGDEGVESARRPLPGNARPQGRHK
jgi:DNA-binding MarR family transcriptional regulator